MIGGASMVLFRLHRSLSVCIKLVHLISLHQVGSLGGMSGGLDRLILPVLNCDPLGKPIAATAAADHVLATAPDFPDLLRTSSVAQRFPSSTPGPYHVPLSPRPIPWFPVMPNLTAPPS